MKNLLFFNPDPEIPDADMLGYGDLVYSDGSTEYVYDDPEIAASLPRPPPGVNPQGAVGMGPPAPEPMQQVQPPQPQVLDLGGKQVQLDPTGTLTPISDPMTGQVIPEQDPAGATDLGGLATSAIQGVGQALEVPPMAQFGMEPQGGAPPGAPQPQIIDVGGGTLVELSPTGDLKPAPPGAQPTQPQGGGMVPVERHGALPPGMAQQQLGALQQQQAATLGATQTARQEENRLYNDLVLKQMAANDAERVKREQDIAEQQAKVERWQQEQQATIDMDIEGDLVSARGLVGGAFAAAGAALLGAAGNDVGFRMIENSIDRHVRQQVARRDTKLGILAQQIGSTQQAIAMGKAALYKVAAERVELLGQKTKSDVYEAQTPMVVEQMRQKALENFQAAEQLSVGKLIERAPPPPKPPSAEALQAYGELRRERDASTGVVTRMEQQLGLIWEPGRDGQPGHYRNKDEVIKSGIEGVGAIEQWVPDWVYSTMGQKDGYQVRGAKQAIAYAVVRQMQPTGPITDVDRKVGEVAATLDTEQGLVQTLERLRNGEQQQQMNDSAQYTPAVVAEYERQHQAAGGMGAPQTPAAAAPPNLGGIRQEIDRRRQTGSGRELGGPAQGATRVIPESPAERMAQAREDAQVLGAEAGLGPEGIAILVAQAAHESGNGDSAGAANGNMYGHKATGGRKAFSAMTTEGEGADERRLPQSFAAYDSIAAATADHLSLLKRKYPRAWEALEVGDPDGYVAALKDGGYFTANEERYRQAILRHL